MKKLVTRVLAPLAITAGIFGTAAPAFASTNPGNQQGGQQGGNQGQPNGNQQGGNQGGKGNQGGNQGDPKGNKGDFPVLVCHPVTTETVKWVLVPEFNKYTHCLEWVWVRDVTKHTKEKCVWVWETSFWGLGGNGGHNPVV